MNVAINAPSPEMSPMTEKNRCKYRSFFLGLLFHSLALLLLLEYYTVGSPLVPKYPHYLTGLETSRLSS